MNEINEGIPHVALVLEVDGQVKEVIMPVVILVDQFQQHRLRVFIWDVFNHYRSSSILNGRDCF